MLRKKDQNQTCQMKISDANNNNYSQSHVLGNNFKSNSILSAPHLFVGMCHKGLLDSDSVKSPTSPLDFTLLSNLPNPFGTRRSSSPNEGQQRSWFCPKVGLGIIDSLEECPKLSGKILLQSENNKTSLIPLMITKTPNCKSSMDSVQASKSLPKDFCKLPYTKNDSVFHKGESTVLFEIGETLLENESCGKSVSCSLDSSSPIKDLFGSANSNFDQNFVMNKVNSPSHFIGGSYHTNPLVPAELNSNPVSASSSDEFIKSLSASEIENSEDYTRVISHGPNPKTTHIFCDCILEVPGDDDLKKYFNREEKEEALPSIAVNISQTPIQYPSGDFLSFCHHCNKKLEEGKDIYIYRGEKAFCCLACRDSEIMIDEELEESDPSPSENSLKLEFGGELFEIGIATAT